MQTISMITQKGGAGKTTIALSLAVALAETGKRVAILDADPQGSAMQWHQSRQGDGVDVAAVEPSKVAATVQAVAQRDYDYCLVDTAGRDAPSIADAAKVADIVLIPCRPTALDMRASVATVQAVQAQGTRFAFVLSQTPPRIGRADKASTSLKQLGAIAPVHIVTRADYQDAILDGQGVTEHKPSGKAANEIRDLAAWVQKQLDAKM